MLILMFIVTFLPTLLLDNIQLVKLAPESSVGGPIAPEWVETVKSVVAWRKSGSTATSSPTGAGSWFRIRTLWASEAVCRQFFGGGVVVAAGGTGDRFVVGRIFVAAIVALRTSDPLGCSGWAVVSIRTFGRTDGSFETGSGSGLGTNISGGTNITNLGPTPGESPRWTRSLSF